MPTVSPTFLKRTDLRLLLFGGKGGVGKTTCAAATALHLARQCPERSFLLVSTDPAHSLSDSFAGPVDRKNLTYREIDFAESFARFKRAHTEHFRQIALRGTFLDEKDIAPMLDLSLPGFSELMAFLEVARLLEDQGYSCIIIDTAPTGHTLRFLELPDLMHVWIEALDAMLGKYRFMVQLYRRSYRPDETDAFLEDLADSIGSVRSILTNPDQCLFVPVVLAEVASTSESSRLVARLCDFRIPVTDILINRLYPAQSECPVCQEASCRQQQVLAKAAVQFAGYSLWNIPLQGGEIRGASELDQFWDRVTVIREVRTNHYRITPTPLQVAEPAPLPSSDVRLLLFSGKGGVGKTTLSCATALYLADRFPDKEVLLFSTDPAHSLSDCLDIPVGPEGVRAGRRLTAMEIDAAAEFAKLKQLYTDEIASFFGAILDQGAIDLEFDRDVIQRILDLSPPGLDEVMALLRAMELLDGGKHDYLVLDTAPTGHLLRLLEMPQLIEGWIQAFFGLVLRYRTVLRLPRISQYLIGLSKELKRLRAILSAPQQGQLYIVSILTEMAYAETCDLFMACQQAGIHVPGLFLNLATPASECSLCQSVAGLEARVHGRFRELFADVHRTVVYRWGEPRGISRLAELGQALFTN